MFGCSLETNSCCCGISLRIGSVAILILNIIGASLAILNHYKISRYGSNIQSIWYVIWILIEIATLYGIFKKKPDYMTPHIFINGIFLVALLLFIISCITILPFSLWSSKVIEDLIRIFETLDEKTVHKDISTTEFYVIYTLGVVILIVFEAIGFHFFKVVFSHFSELKTAFWGVTPIPLVYIEE